MVSKVSEFFDPIGVWEPLKLQLKFSMKKLVHLDWEDPLSPEDQELWKRRFVDYIDIPKVQARRSVINLEDGSKPIRLIGFADAAHEAGGCVIYAGTQQIDGSYSCRMLTAKSKILHATIPRNELTALMLLTELMYITKRAIGSRVQECIYLTDSTVALAWCQPTTRRLRLFVHNRVETVKRMIAWTTNKEDQLPLYHVPGTQNIADLLTKHHDISPEHIDIGSLWESGHEWMKLPTADMPIKMYSEFKVPHEDNVLAQTECFQEPFHMSPDIDATYESHHLSSYTVGTENRDRNLLIDVVGQGWSKAIRILSLILRFTELCKHAVNTRKGVSCNCKTCTYGMGLVSELNSYRLDAESYMFRRESVVIDRVATNKDKLDWQIQDGIFYYVTRLTEDQPFTIKDLSMDLSFFDGTEINGVLPLVLPDSPILFAYLMYVHTNVRPHSGVEVTCREILKKMAVISGLRQLVKRVRKDCIRCKRILLKTIELEMGRHAAARTILSPPFYVVMIDIAMGFNANTFKNARKTCKIYALVIVCLLSSATNILTLEGCETQDICLALERHAARYGVPSCVHVDSGSQLVALKKAEFLTKQLETQMVRSLDVTVKVSTAKAHNLQGRVENKIKVIRSTLEQMGIDAKYPMSVIGWETLFAKIASTIDDTPIAKSNNSNAYDPGFEVLTANRLKMGRNNFRAMTGGGINLDMSSNLKMLLDRNQQIYEQWFRLYIDSIHLFSLRPSLWPRLEM